MNIKMASEEDFTITTKGGHTITFPDRDGTVATESATPVKPATSGQAQTIIDELGNQTYGLSAIKTAVGGITIPNDYATSTQATSIVNKLDSSMYGLSTIMGKVSDNYSAIQGVDAVVHDPNHGNSALKTKLNTIDTRLTDNTNGLTKIREAADAAKDKAIDIYALATGATGFDSLFSVCSDTNGACTAIYNSVSIIQQDTCGLTSTLNNAYTELTDREHGLNSLSGAIDGIRSTLNDAGSYGLYYIASQVNCGLGVLNGIANNIDDPMHGLMVISGELVTIKNGVNSIHIPSDYATSTQATSIISLQRAEAIGVSHISETVDSINDMADDIVNKLDDNTNGLASIKSDVAGLAMGTHPLNTAVANVGIDASAAATNSDSALNIVNNGTYGNQAIKNALTDSTNGLAAIKTQASTAATQATTAATQAANATGAATNIYNYITSNSTGLPKVTDSLDNIAYQVATVDTTVGQVTGMASNINDLVTSNIYGLQAIKNAIDNVSPSVYETKNVVTDPTYGNQVIKECVYDITNKESVIYVAETTRDMLQHPANGLSAIKGVVNSIDTSVSNMSSDVTAIGCGIWDIQHHSTYGLEKIKNVLDDTYHDCSGAYAIVDNQDYGNSSLKTRLVTLSGTLGDVQTVLDNINGASI